MVRRLQAKNPLGRLRCGKASLLLIRESAPFKVNLTLQITGKRADGYHLLETLFAFADSGDELSWEADDALSLTVLGPFDSVAPATEENLVLRAARALQAEFPARAGLTGKLLLTKNVPAGAGLGGGSADAAATLRLLNRVWGLGLSSEHLSQIAAPLGADVPACVTSRPAWARGVGDDLHDLAVGISLPMLVMFPGVPLSTPTVFSAYKPLFSSPKKWPPPQPVLADMHNWHNDLQGTAVSLTATLAQVLDDLARMTQEREDVLFTAMSGSGSACFALCRTNFAVQHLATLFQDRYRPAWIWQGNLVSPFI
jgi:4-diphosphocytidyl-2-C-methyl-D-erythritol kinase